jgi:hypothetical protein
VGCEILKTRNTIALWLTLLYPLGSVFLASLFLFAQQKNVQPNMVNFINNFNGLISFFLPFYAVLMVSFFCQIEHKNSMLKHLYALPIPRWSYYFGKLAATFLLILASAVWMLMLVYAAILFLSIFSTRLRITAEFDHAYLLMMISRSFLSAVALTVIQYLISMRLRNVVAAFSIGISLIILPIAVLFVMGITGLFTNQRLLKWLTAYDPYSFPFSHVFSITSGGNIKSGFYSTELLMWFIAAIIIALGGYFESRNRNIR